MKKRGEQRSSAFSDLAHVGVVVKDSDKVIQRLSALGIGPFTSYHKRLGIVSPVERIVRGEKTDCNLKVMVAETGALLVELTQPEGKCIQSEFLHSRGEGLHHLGFYVDDVGREVASLAEEGLTPVMEGISGGERLFVFYELKQAGGIVFELVKRPVQETKVRKVGEAKGPFSRIDMVAAVVKDVDKASEQLFSLGIGPFKLYRHPSPLIERKLHDELVEAKPKIRVAKQGQVEFQLQQPDQGECLQKEVLETKGEGFLHLGAYVDDLDKEVTDLAQEGVKPVMEGSTAEGRLFAFYEPEDSGGIILELVRRA